MGQLWTGQLLMCCSLGKLKSRLVQAAEADVQLFPAVHINIVSGNASQFNQNKFASYPGW